ncbi:MAG: hypothetical protein R3B47_04045 [Bacteroidia bacterium]
MCKYFYEDGTRIRAFSEPEAFAQEVENQTGEPAAHIHKALKNSRRIYDITHHVFLERSSTFPPASCHTLVHGPSAGD